MLSVINRFGKLIKCEKITDSPNDMNSNIVMNEYHKYSICDDNLKLYFDFVFDDIGGWVENTDISWASFNKKFGIINKFGKIIIPLVMDDLVIETINNKPVIICQKKDKSNIYDLNLNKLIFKFEYDNIFRYSDLDLFNINYNYFSGIFDSNYNKIIDFKYYEIYNISDEFLACVKFKDEKIYDIYDTKGVFITESDHFDVEEFKNIKHSIDRKIKINNFI